MHIEVAAGENRRIVESGMIEDLPRAAAQIWQVAAVEPDRLQAHTLLFELEADLGGVLHSANRIVGVRPATCSLGKTAGEIFE